ncbi:hypothetical protein CASFOL_011524 [Castilleja foliolosa]|uniref:WLM domain-containing protein n=1 Tax=Castilleja foliolosa TaxID=1961234 RepID=A0ABD3DZW5_9LAMI
MAVAAGGGGGLDHLLTKESPGEETPAFQMAPQCMIVVCSNHLQIQDEVTQVVIHELIHAYDECRAANLDWSDCAHHACSEIRAGHLSGDCHYKRELLRGFMKLRGHEQSWLRLRILAVHMDLNDLNKVWEVKPLKKVREDEAREILEKVAKQVQPIMRRRKWKVTVLSEFCPSDPSLMGLNIGGGAEVKLRLRRPNNEWDFFRYEQILDTMLHELCHNEYGPHNTDFDNLLDEIRKECEELTGKGITGTGQGFDFPGRKLGGYSRQPPLSSLRQKALSAAENRAQNETLLPKGPRRIGGDSGIKAVLSPVQAAAMAAERRLHDDLWCGSKSADCGSPRNTAIDSISTQVPKDDMSWQCNTCTLQNREPADDVLVGP